MYVRTIMTANPITVTPSTPVRDAVKIMTEGEFHHLPVLSSVDHLVGVVSLRDCRIALNLPHLDNKTVLPRGKIVRIRDVMTPAPISTTPDTPLADAARLMYENYVGCLPVLIEETLVGIITRSDILMACIEILRKQQTEETPKPD